MEVIVPAESIVNSGNSIPDEIDMSDVVTQFEDSFNAIQSLSPHAIHNSALPIISSKARSITTKSSANRKTPPFVWKKVRNLVAEFTEIGNAGCGQFGVVSIMQRNVDNCVYALKRVTLTMQSLSDEGIVRSVVKEADILKSMQHVNIICLYQFLHEDDDPNFYFLMEYVDGSSLDVIIKKRDSLTVTLIWSFIQQIMSALVYVHSVGILHRDLKPENIMVTNDGKIKLIDFGLSKQLDAGAKTATSFLGTLVYMSHEKKLAFDYDGRDDVWSVGLTLAELITKQRIDSLFPGAVLSDPKRKNMLEELLSLCRTVDVNLASIVRLMCSGYEKRPQAFEVLIQIEHFQLMAPLTEPPVEVPLSPVQANVAVSYNISCA
jgi:serine/threonine protein kinase